METFLDYWFRKNRKLGNWAILGILKILKDKKISKKIFFKLLSRLYFKLNLLKAYYESNSEFKKKKFEIFRGTPY